MTLGPSRIRHTVVFTPQACGRLARGGGLPRRGRELAAIPGVEAFEILRETSPKNGYRFGISMEFAGPDGYTAYNEHPDHVRFVQERWLPEIEDFLEIDYEPSRLLGSADFSEGGRMAIAVHSEKLRELVDENAEVEQVATGFTFTEGPIWHPDGYLLFSDMPGDVRRKYTPGQGVEEVMRPAFKCNGMTLDANLDLIVCEHVTSALWKERRDGSRELLAYHYEGKYLNSPNDVCVRSDGSIYFSDPWYGRFPGFGIERERELGWQGVFRIPPGGGPDDVELVVDQNEFEMPNGVCFSPDESLVYINDTPRAHIKVFDVNADGSFSNGRMFFEGVGSGVIEEGIPDGMKCDERGNIWVTGPGGIWVISAEAEHLGVINVPENTGNLSWGGEDWHTLFIPSSTSLYTIRTKVGPRHEPYMP